VVCCDPGGINLGKEERSESILGFVRGLNCRETSAEGEVDYTVSVAEMQRLESVT
jgi:hypothetical protein